MIDGSRFSSLRGQILTRTLVVGLVPLVALAAVTALGLRGLSSTGDRQVADSRRILIEETVNGRLRSEAETTGREIDLILEERIGDVEAWAQQPAVVLGATVGAVVADQRGLTRGSPVSVERDLAASNGLDSAPTAVAFLSTELTRLPEFRDVLFTDSHGYTVGWAVSIEDYDQHDETWWDQAWQTGSHVGQVETHDQGGDVVPVAVRIDNDRGAPVGVIRASLDVGFVRSVADNRTVDGIDITVITDDRRLLAETASGHDPARFGINSLPFDQLSSGITEALVAGTGSSADETTFYGFAPVKRMFEPNEPGQSDGGVMWHVVATQGADTALAPLAGQEALNQTLGQAGLMLFAAVAIVVLFTAMVAVLSALALSRRIVDPIRTLTRRAERAAHHDLPEAVATLRSADAKSDADTTGAELAIAADSELRQLADAFNSVQNTAIRLAGGQAEQRRETTEMVANLGRRTQSLVKRQIRVIDELEQGEEHPDRLETLFKLDHLATRMRRTAESLLVIAGQRSSQRRAAPARMELVVQRAMGEVKEYERIKTGRIEPVALLGQAVNDTAHILAELVDNALAFSPPETPVVVTGMRARGQYLLSIIDRGIGMSPNELTSTNDHLADGADVDVGTSKQLGLLVVAKLAARHQINVRLRGAEDGGTVALIEIPAALIQPAERASGFDRQQSRAGDSDESAAPAPATPPDHAPGASQGPPSEETTSERAGSPAVPPPAEQPVSPPPVPVGRLLDPDRPSLAPSLPVSHPPQRAPIPVPPSERVGHGADNPGTDGAAAARRGVEVGHPGGDGTTHPARRRDGQPVAEAGRHAPDPPTDPGAPFEPVDRAEADAKPHRRSTDRPAPAPAGPTGSDAPVVRRVSRRPASQIRRPKADVGEKRAVVTTSSADEVDSEAEELRARWSGFQRGRRQAAANSDSE